MSTVLVFAVAMCLLASSQVYAGTPVVATSGVPLPDGVYPGQAGYEAAGYYQYAPSIVQTSDTQRIVYYCANRVRYDRAAGNALAATHDHVLFNVGTRQSNGAYRWGATQVALRPRLQPGDPDHHPATPAWAAYHICDPDVVSGRFTYAAPGLGRRTYTWAMFFTGADNDDHGADGRFNVVGVALATSPLGPWTIVASPVVDITEPDYNPAGYGVGQPSVTSVDGQGRLLLFYSGLDCAALDTPNPSCDGTERGTARRTLDLGDANAPVLGTRSFVTTAGLTPEPFLPDSGRFLHNASWAYDGSRDSFVVSRDTGALEGNEVQRNVEVDRIAGASVWAGGGTWTVLGQITGAHSGYRWNHNSGLVRDPYGGLAYQRPLDYSGVDVYFATEPGTGDGPPPWDGYFSYRMRHSASPL
ncbi:hypothetical protein RB614_27380 [Phytohabitans sp. ZYX-F-186]|uniref:Alpha-L-arabinofuranosidase B arabinose-binding domain-containing protein n=1 Tax=Phytohabitans maris TaxID=3071409 RepID=A0ABU0ZMJ7_9ACTN|nr:hypothetical protein [Phytohabitans sp. ZYX-F-186]MDQ7908254.1 hypothetical protein [Phytohabitans sp. ZYX-F-186]